jgi:hypothetical protein
MQYGAARLMRSSNSSPQCHARPPWTFV